MMIKRAARTTMAVVTCIALILGLGGCNDTADIDPGSANASAGTAGGATGGAGSDDGNADGSGSGNGGDGGSDGPGSAVLPLPQPGPDSNRNFDTFGDNGVFLSILPPGASDTGGTGSLGDLPPVAASPHFNDQLAKYRDLTFAPEDLTTDQLVPTYFHNESFRPESAFGDSLRTVSDGAHSARYVEDDETGTPHIYADSRADVFFGIGYVNGRERLFLMDALRHIGRGRFSDFLGPAAGNYDMDRDIGLFAGYSEQEMQRQIEDLANRYGATAAQLRKDAEAFVAGINTYIANAKDINVLRDVTPIEYPALQLRLRDFTVRDILSTAILIVSRFATGGGAEHLNARLLNGIGEQFGRDPAACGLWHDILQADDPERPNTITARFETQSPPTFDTEACPFDAGFKAEYPGAVLFDTGSFQPRQLLTIENCGLVSLSNCPDYKQDPVIERRFDADSEPDATDSMAVAGNSDHNGARARVPARTALDYLFDGGSDNTPPVKAASGPVVARAHIHRWMRAVQAVHRARMAQGLQRAQDTVDGLLAYVHAQQQGAVQFPTAMSNALLVTGDNTANGRPLAVFGPQTSYFAPELELEFEAHGGGIDTRGMNFAGLPFVLIGRGKDFAWSATSASADVTDIRALKLCEPDDPGGAATQSSGGYLYNGQCKPFYTRTDVWTAETNLTTALQRNQMVTRRIMRAPDYGPVLGFATVDGQPIALAIQRSTFMGTLGAALPFTFLNGNVVHDPESFMKAFNLMNGTFNWFYIDNDNIAYFMSGLLPKRADGIYPELPQWGTGDYDWAQTQTGTIEEPFDVANFLPLANHPHAVNPERGYLTSWNNAQAPGFYANDDQYGYGPVYRVDMLNKRLTDFLDGGERLQPADLVSIMMDGGSTDLRGQEILPLALEILQQSDAEPALTEDQQAAVDILSNWITDGPNDIGAMRRDRNDDGEYDNRQAVVLMDSWYNRMIDAALPQLVQLENTGAGNVMPLGRDNHPGDMGSAYQSGYYDYLQRVFAMAQRESAHPYDTLQCADTGERADCRQALIASLDEAIDALGGIDNRDNWDGTQDNNGQRDGDMSSDDVETRDMISFRAIGLAGVQDILWQNRPTFQQVVSPTQSRTAR